MHFSDKKKVLEIFKQTYRIKVLFITFDLIKHLNIEVPNILIFGNNKESILIILNAYLLR